MDKYFRQYGWSCLTISEHSLKYDASPKQSPVSRKELLPTRRSSGWLTVRYRLYSFFVGLVKKLLRATGWSGRTGFHYPDPEIYWYRQIRKKTLKDLYEFGPDLIISSFPPVSSHRLANFCAKKLDIPWVADYRDEWSTENYFRPRGGIWKIIDQLVEMRTLRRASFIITVSKPIGDNLKRLNDKHVYIMENGFDLDDYPTDRELNEFKERNDFGDKFEITFTGHLSLKNNLSSIFDGINLALENSSISPQLLRVNFVGTVDPLFMSSVKKRKYPFDVRFIPRVGYRESLCYQKASNLLVMPEWLSSGASGVYSSKIFTYLGSRKPVLFLGASNHIIAELLRETEAGYCTQNALEVEAVITELWTYWASGNAAEVSGDIDYYSRKNQIFALCEYLEKNILAFPSASA